MRTHALLSLAALLAGCSSAGAPADAGQPPVEPGWRVGFASPEGSVSLSAMALGADDSVYVAGGSWKVPAGAVSSDQGNGLALVVKLAADGRQLWRKDLDGVPTTSWNWDDARVVAVDPRGDVVVAGQFSGTIDLGGGPLRGSGFYDIYLAKLDADGNHLWSRTFVADGEQIPRGLVIDDAGGIYLSGQSVVTSVDLAGHPLAKGSSYAFLARLDGDGNLVWERNLSNNVETVAVASAKAVGGGIILSGTWKGTLDLGGTELTASGPRDGFVASLDADGAHRWHFTIANDGNDQIRDNRIAAVASDSNGGLVAVASFLGRHLTIGDQTYANRTHGDYDEVLVRLSSDGHLAWSAQLEARPSSLVVDDGGIWMAGTFNGTSHLGASVLTTRSPDDTDILIARLAPDGRPIEATALPDQGFDLPIALAVGRDGARALAGTTGPSPANNVRGRAAFVTKLR